ncbi:hypothetical protein J3Q64DRAFT_1816721 [Phycomyces blakesleeanus]|uniref:Uncharacterized protein n=1 Tax=Phycomyces blakesleeanus TaxID=4837 RepID=A0ABR3BBG5_PHYBL
MAFGQEDTVWDTDFDFSHRLGFPTKHAHPKDLYPPRTVASPFTDDDTDSSYASHHSDKFSIEDREGLLADIDEFMYETPEPPTPPAAAALAAACLDRYKGLGTITRLGRHRYVEDDGDWNEDVVFQKPNGTTNYVPATETALDDIDDYNQPQPTHIPPQPDPKLTTIQPTKYPNYAEIKAEEEEWDISEFTNATNTRNYQPLDIQHPKPVAKKISAVLNKANDEDDDFFTGMDFKDSFLKPTPVQNTTRLTPRTFASTPSTSQKLPSPSVLSARNRPIPSDSLPTNSPKSTSRDQTTSREPSVSKSQGSSRNQNSGPSANRSQSSRSSLISSGREAASSSRITEKPKEIPVWDRLSKPARDPYLRSSSSTTTSARRQSPLSTLPRHSPEATKVVSPDWRSNGGGLSHSVDSRSTDAPPQNNSPLHLSTNRIPQNRREIIRPRVSVAQSLQGQSNKKKIVLRTKTRAGQRDGTELDRFDNLSEWGATTPPGRVTPKIKPTLRVRQLNESSAGKVVDTKDQDRPWRQNMKRNNVSSILPGDRPLVNEQNGMKYDPVNNKWNGNENSLLPFDHPSETRRRPARIRNRNNAIKHNHIVGDMYFDHLGTTWRKLPKSKPNSLDNSSLGSRGQKSRSKSNFEAEEEEENDEDDDPLRGFEDLQESPLRNLPKSPTPGYFIALTPQDIRNNASKTKPEFELSLDTQRLMFEEEKEHREFMANWILPKDYMIKTAYGNLAPPYCFLILTRDH